MTARLLEVTPDEYHALPGFSATIAKELIARSPAHAKAMVGKEPTKAMDRGTVLHTMVLGKGKRYEPVPFDDYRTKAARKTRDDYRAAGYVPILHHELDGAAECAATIARKLADRGIVFNGRSEAAIEWTEQTPHGPVLCRGMLDHLWLDEGRILDLKITDDASLTAVERTAENLGYAIQAAAYERAIIALRPKLAGRVRFEFAFCEPYPPFAVHVLPPDGEFSDLGERRWRRAVNEWARCTATYGDHAPWPEYGHGINRISAPGWVLAREGYVRGEDY